MEKYETSVDRLRGALDAAGVGTWSWDLATGEVEFSANFEQVLGVAPRRFDHSFDGFMDLVHPDDREHLIAATEEAVATGAGFDREFRIVGPEGDVAWLAGRGRVVADESGDAVRMLGVTFDITDRKRAEEALRANEARLAEAQRTAHIGSFEWDVEREMLLWSDEMYRIYGLDPARASPSFSLFMECVHPDDRERVASVIEGALERREHYRVDYRVVRPDGVVRMIEAQARVVEGEGGEIRLAGTGQDVTELRETQQRAQTLAAQAVLHAERNRLSTLMEGVSDAFVSFDREWRYTYVNRRAAELLQREAGELVGQRIWDLFPDMIPAEVAEAFHRVMHTREPESIEFHFEPFDLWFEDRIYPTEEGISVFFTDITDRKQAEAATRRSERWFRALTENALDIITITDADGRIRYATPAGARVLGYVHGELASANILEIVHEDDRPVAQEAMTRLQRSGDQVRVQLRVQAKNGSWQVHEVIGTSRLDDPVIRGIVLNSRDVTDRLRTEEALRQSEERFRLLIENASDVLHLQDADGRILYITPSVEPVLGYDPQSLAGERIGALVHPDDLSQAERMLSECLSERGRCDPVELRLRHASGSWKIVHVTGRNLGGRGGSERVAFYTRDVTEARRTEEILRRQALIVRTMSEAVVTADTEGRITEWNPAAERMFGYSREEVLGRSPVFVQPEEDRGRREDLVRAVEEKGYWSGEFEALRKDGSRLVCATHVVAVRGANGELVGTLGVTRDITERRHAEEESRRNEDLFRTLVETSMASIAIVNEDGSIQFVNGGVERVLGHEREVVIGRPILDYVHPDDRSEIAKAFRHRAGTPGTGTPMEFRVRHVDGSWRLLEARADNLFEQPAVRGIMITGRDVTEQREMEAELRQMQKMEAVGRLAGGIAHDFNNLLTAVIGHTEMLLLDAEEGTALAEDLGEIRRAADRAAALTRQLLAFSRKQVLQPRVTDLNAVVRGTERMLRRLLGDDVEMQTHLDDAIPCVFADPGQMEQVVVNLAVNARDAMPSGGTVVVRTGGDRSTPAAPLHPELAPGEYVVLSVADTGTGMDAETVASAFEPFFTTKPVGQGTGLGLSTVYGIVRQSGGHVWVESEPGAGSTFVVCLPAHTGAAAEAAEEPTPFESRRGRETILLVEDDDAVRSLARRSLTRAGYTVLEAACGEEALEIADDHDGPIGLMLTDVMMPGMNGREVAERLADIRTGVPVLYMTGFTEGAIVDRGVLEPGTDLIEKPFSPAALTARVRSVLDRLGSKGAR